MPEGIFDPANTAKSVHDTLDAAYATLPPDARSAIVVDASTQGGVQAYYVHRNGNGWQTVIGGEWGGKGHVEGKVAVMKVWK